MTPLLKNNCTGRLPTTNVVLRVGEVHSFSFFLEPWEAPENAIHPGSFFLESYDASALKFIGCSWAPTSRGKDDPPELVVTFRAIRSCLDSEVIGKVQLDAYNPLWCEIVYNVQVL